MYTTYRNKRHMQDYSTQCSYKFVFYYFVSPNCEGEYKWYFLAVLYTSSVRNAISALYRTIPTANPSLFSSLCVVRKDEWNMDALNSYFCLPFWKSESREQGFLWARRRWKIPTDILRGGKLANFPRIIRKTQRATRTKPLTCCSIRICFFNTSYLKITYFCIYSN